MGPDRKFNLYVQAFLAIFITVGFFGVIVGLMTVPSIPDGTKDILLVMLGALLASYKELTGYFFGSSSGSATKDTALAASSAAKDTALAAAATAAGGMPRERRASDPDEHDGGDSSVTIPTTTTIVTKEVPQ